MCQFRFNQPIPGRAHQPDQLHSVTLSGRTDEVWHVTHAAYIHRWDTRRERIQIGTPLEASLTSASEYMKWYRRNTRRGRSSASLGQVTTTAILGAFGEHDRTLLQQISQSAQPSHTLVQSPPEEVELGGSRARRRRTGLAANRTRLRDDEPSSSSNHGTQSSNQHRRALHRIRPSSICHSIYFCIQGT
ncbi:hypothetical protein PIB30_031888 [Stylosanthes scabra]|uniref:Uncharacterized protein n=1 Tax=Stylosanthes scabra TaxID=79078 RepID=A0ABU6WBY7_9FABA|nr:hypothetical protein [Stylosanthes scabra]